MRPIIFMFLFSNTNISFSATWVGGGFINGSAEETYKAGLIWTQAPFGYGLSLFISGTFFAKKMRDAEYLTMIDPFTQKYGRWGALQALPGIYVRYTFFSSNHNVHKNSCGLSFWVHK